MISPDAGVAWPEYGSLVEVLEGMSSVDADDRVDAMVLAWRAMREGEHGGVVLDEDTRRAVGLRLLAALAECGHVRMVERVSGWMVENFDFDD